MYSSIIYSKAGAANFAHLYNYRAAKSQGEPQEKNCSKSPTLSTMIPSTHGGTETQGVRRAKVDPLACLFDSVVCQPYVSRPHLLTLGGWGRAKQVSQHAKQLLCAPGPLSCRAGRASGERGGLPTLAWQHVGGHGHTCPSVLISLAPGGPPMVKLDLLRSPGLEPLQTMGPGILNQLPTHPHATSTALYNYAIQINDTNI